jgi:hypothetical protein
MIVFYLRKKCFARNGLPKAVQVSEFDAGLLLLINYFSIYWMVQALIGPLQLPMGVSTFTRTGSGTVGHDEVKILLIINPSDPISRGVRSEVKEEV